MAEQGEMEVRKKEEIEGSEGIQEGAYFRPPVDIYETDEALHIRADVPGCDPEQVDVNLEENRLTLTANTSPVGERWEQVYGEYREGHFMREFRLGKDIDRAKISAKMSNGVLELTLPKAATSKPKKIEVKTD